MLINFVITIFFNIFAYYQFKLMKKQSLGMEMYYNALSERLKDMEII